MMGDTITAFQAIALTVAALAFMGWLYYVTRPLWRAIASRLR